MSHEENMPFERGFTFFNGETTNANDGFQFEGKEWWTEDTQNKVTGSQGRMVRLRCVRNVGAAALESKRLVRYKASTPGQVDGYATVEPTQHVHPVDDAYGSKTIPVNDLFYVVVEGPCLIKTSLVGGAENVIAVDDLLVSATAATSGATTAGRIKSIDMTGATAVLGNQLNAAIGRALTARTTANTNTDTLVEIGRW